MVPPAGLIIDYTMLDCNDFSGGCFLGRTSRLVAILKDLYHDLVLHSRLGRQGTREEVGKFFV
ncbi:MAG: hypothetical protein D3924_12755 [Candidatus Electrothrix sp. AR4]|nr:hypothetical protein [Candidatus Electrothrix sp. AR4]